MLMEWQNSVDPDQTASSEAVWSWSALFAETYLSQYIEFVRYTSSTPHHLKLLNKGGQFVLTRARFYPHHQLVDF